MTNTILKLLTQLLELINNLFKLRGRIGHGRDDDDDEYDDD